MMVADHRLLDAAKAHSVATLALVDALRSARGVEWEAPPGASLRIEHDFHADHTGETASDPARLKVRAAVENGLAILAHASAQLDRATSSLEDALRPYVTQDVTQAPLTR
jgi:hypothetical protein